VYEMLKWTAARHIALNGTMRRQT